MSGNGIRPVRVLTVDQHALRQQVLATLLASAPEVEIVGEADSLDSASSKVSILKPDLIILDAELPGWEGAGACAAITRRHTHAGVLFVSGSQEEAALLAAFRARARGFLLRQSDPLLLRVAVRAVASGGVFVDPRVAGTLVSLAVQGGASRGPHGLTPGELRILRLLPRGLSNREIADELGVSVETVKTHVRGVFRKLEVSDRVRAAAIAIKEGLG